MSLALAVWLFSTVASAQTPAATDYLHVPGPIQFNKTSWHLQWSSHPAANYYKQEYFTTGDNVEHFSKMLSIDYLRGQATVKDLAGHKVAELKKMKESNPMVQYQVFEKDGEVLLDFLVSANNADGKRIDILERNVYRYVAMKDPSGVVLFSLSERAYGKDVTAFLNRLKTGMEASRNAVAAFAIPAVHVK